jgi:predicted MFS family arabinose efflux permease
VRRGGTILGIGGDDRARGRALTRARASPVSALLTVAIGLVFADSAIVVLALPDLIGRFHASVEGVSWVITAYNLVVAVLAPALPLLCRRVGPKSVAAAGLAVFAAASLGCAIAGSLSVLIGMRALQGAGGALFLAGSLGLVPGRGWRLASTLGLAAGPATGGVLTQLFDWRAIFVVQVPLALAALLAAARTEPLAPGSQTRAIGRPRAVDGMLLLVSSALVGGLFLSVVLLVRGWGLSPIAAAGALSAVPSAGLVAALVGRRLAVVPAAAAGCVLLAAGLVGFAFVPAGSVLGAILVLALAGAGLGLVLDRGLADHEVAPAATTQSWGGWSIGARHAGLVLGTLLLAPVLAANLDGVGARAERAGAQRLAASPLPLAIKITLAVDLAASLAEAPADRLPDLSGPFARAQARAGDAAQRRELEELRRSLDDLARDAITDAFRVPFLLAAAFALLALVPLGVMRAGRTVRRPAPAAAGPA